MRLIAPLSVTIMVAVSACGPSADEQAAETERTSELPFQAPAAIAALQQFVDTAASNDLYASEAGKLAQEKGTSQAVKALGAMMVEHHTASTAALKTALAESQPELILSPQLTEDQQTKLAELRNAPDFDAAFTAQQAAAHEETLSLLRDYGVSGGDAALREYASKTAALVERHLAQAQKLQ